MKNIVIVLLSLVCTSCIKAKPIASSCFKLETCPLYNGLDEGSLIVPCVVGFSATGERTKEVYRFSSRENLEIWSQLHLTAKQCN